MNRARMCRWSGSPPTAGTAQGRGLAFHYYRLVFRPQRLTEAIMGCDAVIVHLAWVLRPNHSEPFMGRISMNDTANALAAVAERRSAAVCVRFLPRCL